MHHAPRCNLSYFYPRPPRGGRHAVLTANGIATAISIHALREEGDNAMQAINSAKQSFLSTPSARRATRHPHIGHRRFRQFLSTPSARRATSALSPYISEKTDFYPRPPRGGRRALCHQRIGDHDNFYPRPPRGGRQQPAGKTGGQKRFLSTPSARRATRAADRCFRWLSHFYPRPPRGGRLPLGLELFRKMIFLSTPSARRATTGKRLMTDAEGISIHALREEGDLLFNCWLEEPYKFLSTPSARRATSVE